MVCMATCNQQARWSVYLRRFEKDTTFLFMLCTFKTSEAGCDSVKQCKENDDAGSNNHFLMGFGGMLPQNIFKFNNPYELTYSTILDCCWVLRNLLDV